MAAEVGGKGKKMPRIDMTPMVDLGFLLLTFFILTTTMTTPSTMPVVVPPKIKKEEEKLVEKDKLAESRVMTILMDKDNQVFWYQGVKEPEMHMTNFSKTGGIRDAIIGRIKDLRNNPKFGPNEKTMMFLLKFTDKSTYKNMVDILDEMNVLSQKSYAIVDVSKDEIGMIEDYRKKEGA